MSSGNSVASPPRPSGTAPKTSRFSSQTSERNLPPKAPPRTRQSPFGWAEMAQHSPIAPSGIR